MHSFTLPIHHPKPWLYSTIASLIVLGVIFALPAMASVQESIFSLLGAIVLPIISFLGSVLLMLIEILIGVFQFTEFIDTPAVQLGWVIVRDIANIAIVVALIIIAFATVFRIQKYAASQLLVRLIIAAFLVNFSLLIAGLFIDFGQVLMMTFVNQFQSLAAGNLTVGLGIEAMLKVSTGEAGVGIASGAGLLEGGTGLLAAMFLAVVLLLIAIGVILVLIVVLLQRIIYIWILSIFAPIAWVSPLLPGGSRWGGSWWSNFSKQVLIGPLLAFGFWLSMSVLAGLSAQQSLISLSVQNTNPAIRAENSAQIARFVSEVSTPQAIFDFMVTIALLLGTIWMAKSAGGVAGSFAGKSFNYIASRPGAIYKRATRPIRETLGAYKGMRESVRREKTAKRAAALSEGVGFAKRQMAKPVTGTVRGLKKVTGVERKRQEIQDKRSLARDLREQAATAPETKKAQLIAQAEKLEKEAKSTARWVHPLESTKTGIQNVLKQGFKADSESISKLRDSANKKEEELLAIQDKESLTDADFSRMQTLKSEINQERARADKRETRGQDIDKAVDLGGKVLKQSAKAGLVLVNPAMLAAYIPNAFNKLEKSGIEQGIDAKNYIYREVGKAKDGLKDLKDEQILKIKDDPSNDSFTRMASILEALQRGLFKDTKEALGQRENLRSLGADQKTISTANAFISRSFPQADLGYKERIDKIKDGTMDIKQLKVDSLVANKGELMGAIAKEGSRADFESAADKNKKAAKKALNESVPEIMAKDGIAIGNELFELDEHGKEKVRDSKKSTFKAIGRGIERGDMEAILDYDTESGAFGKEHQKVFEALLDSKLNSKEGHKVLAGLNADILRHAGGDNQAAESVNRKVSVDNLNKLYRQANTFEELDLVEAIMESWLKQADKGDIEVANKINNILRKSSHPLNDVLSKIRGRDSSADDENEPAGGGSSRIHTDTSTFEEDRKKYYKGK